MYQEISKISQFLSEPFFSLYSGAQAPIAVAFLLGLIGALAPCQLTGNISAITFYGNRSLQTSQYWGDVIFFILGKIAVFTGLGLLVWMIGQNFQQNITMIFPFFRKIIGPFLVLLGLFLLSYIKLNIISKISNRIPLKFKSGRTGSFIMGASFSIAFCPTMFVLFFVTLMPVVLTSSYGFFLPAVFGIGTSIPVLVIIGAISFLGLSGALLKKSKNIGRGVQRFAGIVLILFGILDIVTYWF
ncbi:sulfite exporter TauE/SafE family protein [Bacillus sp. DTU_2020_1000418_1_SI_GHA_SEK_038]|uniref:urease accessory protein UreH domain-containing protein n=1 Tax=Bacillus sp. DTU_2020_1000418_1_SI_GHA_SEK_038 TaxID=3077585 RepID=UPI0028E97B12|nr:sulfite exporter TauE/SafE family protein [Bacillus sp. DTU_2020_1000418_1_SI_GHA_SEK_038]WNS74933.1 sulfite exporter TauE/SafE family protein [Bacillus sp. DTU_2020_1000418_1_SI_GHA_SEK_038]